MVCIWAVHKQSSASAWHGRSQADAIQTSTGWQSFSVFKLRVNRLQAGGGSWNSLPDRFSITSKSQRSAAQDVLMQRILGDGAQGLQSQVQVLAARLRLPARQQCCNSAVLLLPGGTWSQPRQRTCCLNATVL